MIGLMIVINLLKMIFLFFVDVFPDDTCAHLQKSVNDWIEKLLKNINNLLLETFVSLRKSGELKRSKKYDNYIRSLQTAFRMVLKQFDSGSIFYKPDTGPHFVLDNIWKNIQANGHSSEAYNVLTAENIYTLYLSYVLRKAHPLGWIT